MRKSLQAIDDFYQNKGLKGGKLRKALLKDKDYQAILKERRQKLVKKIGLTSKEKKSYVMSLDKDFEILAKIKKLEKLKLNEFEKFLVTFARTQLEHDWRKHIIKELNKALHRHKQ